MAPTSVMLCATAGAKKKSAAIAALITVDPLLMTGIECRGTRYPVCPKRYGCVA
jgi:hypothetical protein